MWGTRCPSEWQLAARRGAVSSPSRPMHAHPRSALLPLRSSTCRNSYRSRFHVSNRRAALELVPLVERVELELEERGVPSGVRREGKNTCWEKIPSQFVKDVACRNPGCRNGFIYSSVLLGSSLHAFSNGRSARSGYRPFECILGCDKVQYVCNNNYIVLDLPETRPRRAVNYTQQTAGHGYIPNCTYRTRLTRNGR